MYMYKNMASKPDVKTAASEADFIASGVAYLTEKTKEALAARGKAILGFSGK